MLKFEHANGKIYNIKYRTKTQIINALSKYYNIATNKNYKYIANSQTISINNGNIYADFAYYNDKGDRMQTYAGNDAVVRLMICDYSDYINDEIN